MEEVTSYFGKPMTQIEFDELVQMPRLTMQTASLTPLEKSQIALLVTAIKPMTIIETGVWRGLTTRFISELLSMNAMDGRIVGFDFPEVIDELVADSPYFRDKANITFVKGILPESLEQWLAANRPTIDLAVIDADHNYFAAYTELIAIAPYMAEDGYIFCHDYGLDQSNHEGVLCAVNDFCRRFGFTMLPFQSRPSAPKTLRSCQSVILRKEMKTSFGRRISHLKKYVKRKFFTKPKDIKLYKLS